MTLRDLLATLGYANLALSLPPLISLLPLSEVRRILLAIEESSS